MVQTRIKEYQQSENKEDFKNRIFLWKNEREKFLNDHKINKKDDYILRSINLIIEEIGQL